MILFTSFLFIRYNHCDCNRIKFEDGQTVFFFHFIHHSFNFIHMNLTGIAESPAPICLESAVGGKFCRNVCMWLVFSISFIINSFHRICSMTVGVSSAHIFVCMYFFLNSILTTELWNSNVTLRPTTDITETTFVDASWRSVELVLQ